jgi:hypothetical protein
MMNGGDTMEDRPQDTGSELACAVTIYDGAWVTCDMIADTRGERGLP